MKLEIKNHKLISKLTFILFSCLVFVAALVYMQNNVLLQLLSNAELSTLSNVSASTKDLFGVDLPQNIAYAPYWFVASLTLSLFNTAYLTAALFMLSAAMLLSICFYMYHRSWPAFVITLLFATLSSGLTLSYGLRPELLLLLQFYIGFWGFLGTYRGKGIGLLAVFGAILLGLLLGFFGWLFSLTYVLFLIVSYSHKTTRQSLARLDPVSWGIVVGGTILLVAPWIYLLLNGYVYEVQLPDFNIFKNAQEFGKLLLLGSTDNPFFWSQNWPLYSVGGLLLNIAGITALWFWREASRNKFMLMWYTFGLALPVILGVSLSSMVVLIALQPFIMVAGLRLMHERWLRVFPLNPTAHKISIGLLSLVLLIIGAFHINRQLDYLPQLEEFNARYSYSQPQ